MKAALFFLFIVLLALAVLNSSCNKNFTCTCTDITTKTVVYRGSLSSYSKHTGQPQCDAKGASEKVVCELN